MHFMSGESWDLCFKQHRVFIWKTSSTDMSSTVALGPSGTQGMTPAHGLHHDLIMHHVGLVLESDFRALADFIAPRLREILQRQRQRRQWWWWWWLNGCEEAPGFKPCHAWNRRRRGRSAEGDQLSANPNGSIDIVIWD
jgi:hypothetical protein